MMGQPHPAPPPCQAGGDSERLLAVRDLTVGFAGEQGFFNAVEDLSFDIRKGEILGLVGESGCGKSVTALSLLRLIPTPPGRIVSGQVRFHDRDILALSPRELRAIRGQAISMIFQEPSAALSPLHRIGQQLVEGIRLHHPKMSKKAAFAMARDWLEKVRLPDPEERMYSFPYQLSGGMQQRVMIAMALMLEPELVIADEPTTALDVTVQAQVFHLIGEMRQRHTAILLITHDMGVVWETCDRVAVMYAARLAETGTREQIFSHPSHPYTQGLLNAIPRLTGEKGALSAIPGQVPAPTDFPTGCHFRDRCPHAFERCAEEIPPLFEVAPGHQAACFLLETGI